MSKLQNSAYCSSEALRLHGHSIVHPATHGSDCILRKTFGTSSLGAALQIDTS